MPKAISSRAQHFRGFQKPRRQRVRHTSSGFNPLTLSSLVAWYDFSDVATLWKDTSLTDPVTADADVIKGVTDKSGLTHSLTEATNGPAYKVNIQNGKSIARFDGSNDILGGPTNDAHLAITGPVTVVAVVSLDDTLTYHPMIDYATNVTSKIAYEFRTDNAATTLLHFLSGDAVTVEDENATAATTKAAFHIVVARRDADSVDFFEDGTAKGTPAHSLTPAPDASSKLWIGTRATNDLFFDGDFGEAYILNAALTSTELNALGGYLATKWGLTWTTVA